MIFVVWLNETTSRNIFFAKSVDNGGTFSFPDNINETSSSARDPQIAISANNIYAVWHGNVSSPNNNGTFFTKSTDNGGTFSQIKNINPNINSSQGPQIAVSGDNVYVVWGAIVGSQQDIFFTVSTNNGQTFSIPDNISENDGSSTFPQIAVSGSNVYVIWSQSIQTTRDIFFTVSTNNGQNFSQPQNISNSAGRSSSPQISVSDDNVYVVWYESDPTNIDNDDIFFTVSTNNGQNFSQPQNISNNTNTSRHPQIAVSGDNVYVVWDDDTPTNIEIFFAVSTNNGRNFSQPENISNNIGGSLYPQIAVSGSNVYVVWFDYTPSTNSDILNSDIFFAVSTNNGQEFSQPQNISNNTERSRYPKIAVSGNNVYVVWRNTTTSPPTNSDIFFAVSTNNGQEFSQPEKVSPIDGYNRDPQIAVSSSS